MNFMKKRIISLLLALALILGTTPTAFAASGFTDVPEDTWYAKYVEYCCSNGLMAGTGADTFAPNAHMTRAMAVTVLYRIAGSPEISRANPFTDVRSDSWYHEAVLWAVDIGVTSGTSDTTFSPNANVTREQLVTFLYRYVQTTGVKITHADITGYEDRYDISRYARVAFAWAVDNGIVTGVSADRLGPAGTATRAQCATILTQFDKFAAEAEPYTPAYDDIDENGISVAEAAAVGNAYAASTYGMKVTPELGFDNAGFNFADSFYLTALEVMGMQKALNQATTEKVDCFVEGQMGAYGETLEDVAYYRVNCHVEYDPDGELYWIYVFYG